MGEPRLLESAIRRWWIVLLTFAVTTVLTILWVTPKPAVYESTGTYVVQPRQGASDDSARALDTLVRGTQINATFALIARSDSIENSAESRLAHVHENAHLDVSAAALTGANALTISARARDAKSAHALAVAAGAETIAYVDSLQQPYQLELLDPPQLPSQPVNSRKTLTIVLGALLGLMLGLGLAAVIDRIVLLRRARRGGTITTPTALAPALATVQPDRRAWATAWSSTTTTSSGVTELGEPVDLVADAISDPGVQLELVRAADRAVRYCLGVLRLEAVHANGNGNGNSNSNGNDNENGDAAGHEQATRINASNGLAVDHEATNGKGAGRLELLFRDQVLRNGERLTYLRDGLFATVLSDTSATKATKLLSDWLADASVEDEDDDTSSVRVSMRVVEYFDGDTTTETPESTSG